MKNLLKIITGDNIDNDADKKDIESIIDILTDNLCQLELKDVSFKK